MTDQTTTQSRWVQLLWFVALWAGGVVTIGIVGLLIKLVLRP